MKRRIDRNIEVSRFTALSRFRDISHFITTRHGGVSEGNFASMNPALFSDDNYSFIRMNLQLLSDKIGVSSEHIIMPHQTHGDRVVVVDDKLMSLPVIKRNESLDGVDALITQLSGICVAVATADCVPVLLFAADRGVVAAVHAGWRGTVAYIAKKTVEKMVDNFGCDPSSIIAGIGPSISREAFEVGEEVVDEFSSAGFNMDAILSRDNSDGKGHIDLWEANRLLLIDAGLKYANIETMGICTYNNYKDYFSARRLGIKSGRIVSGICLVNNGNNI